MSKISQQPPVAVVGSPSSNTEITLDLLENATREPLVGSMLFLTQPSGQGTELGLGMVTTVTTQNQWHTNSSLRGVVKTRGSIPGMSGDAGDVRQATIKLQAAYKNNQPDNSGPWKQSGPNLRMSPPTGTVISKVTDDVFNELIEGEPDIHYLGHMHGSNTKIPMQIRDFSGDRGAWHAGVFGSTGSGKSQAANYLLAGQMRHRDHGVIIVDPQGQFASETGMAFSLQAFAEELGREVIVRRISEDLRLEQDATLFGELLGKTRFIREIMKMSTEIQELVVEESVKILKTIENWTDQTSENLLDKLLDGLRKPNVLRRIYSDNTKKIRLMVALSEIMQKECVETIEGEPIQDITSPEYRDYQIDTTENRRQDALSQFLPLHNLFSKTNPNGDTRHSLWKTVSQVFDKNHRGNQPAPLLILDMSTSGEISWIKNLLEDDETQNILEAIQIIDQDNIKAAILRQVFRTLKNASETSFRQGENLNTVVTLDEAWRYAPPPYSASDPEIKALSTDLAGYFRDTRKFGIGWLFISQSPRSINQDCWDQMSVRIMGYGLAGPDIEKVSEQLDDRDHLRLYRGFAPPDSTNPKIYPFMVTGPVSPLSFSKAPIFLSAYTNFQDFRDDNHEWIRTIRLAMGQDPLSGTPTHPGGNTTQTRLRPRRTTPNPYSRQAREDAERIRQNRKTGGVDPANMIGLGTDPTFGSALDLIEEDQPPF